MSLCCILKYGCLHVGWGDSVEERFPIIPGRSYLCHEMILQLGISSF